jgi:hypothetical protein
VALPVAVEEAVPEAVALAVAVDVRDVMGLRVDDSVEAAVSVEVSLERGVADAAGDWDEEQVGDGIELWEEEDDAEGEADAEEVIVEHEVGLCVCDGEFVSEGLALEEPVVEVEEDAEALSLGELDPGLVDDAAGDSEGASDTPRDGTSDAAFSNEDT